MVDAPQRGAAFAPGHVTGFFTIHADDAEPARKGSRGAGVCLDAGATTLVTLEPADAFELEVVIDGTPAEAAVTRDAVVHVLKHAVADGRVGLNRDNPPGQRAKVRCHVYTELGLPQGQGFGMSAAGALSSALATAKALRMGRSLATEAAHLAEVHHRTGLGDVMGAVTGGFEVRVAPGLPPWGAVHRFLGYGQFVVAIVGDPVATRDVLGDAGRRAKVDEVGAKVLEAFLPNPSLEAFIGGSRTFAEETGLETPPVEEALAAVAEVPETLAFQAMLGNSILALGDTEHLVKVLEDQGGDVRVCGVDGDGARPLVVEDAEGDARSGA